MMRLRSLFSNLALAATVLIVCSGARAGILAVDLPSPNLFQDGTTNETVGWQFTLSNTVDVTALGVFHYTFDGPNQGQAHQIGIWDLSQNLLAQATIPAGAPVNQVPSTGQGFWDFVDLPSQVVLAPGTYRIGAYYPNFVDGNDGGSIPIHVAPGVTYVGGVTNCCTNFSFPNSLAGTGQFGPNFQFVPEPSSVALFFLGGLAIAASRKRRKA
jgi:hypothetical protein